MKAEATSFVLSDSCLAGLSAQFSINFPGIPVEILTNWKARRDASKQSHVRFESRPCRWFANSFCHPLGMQRNFVCAFCSLLSIVTPGIGQVPHSNAKQCLFSAAAAARMPAVVEDLALERMLLSPCPTLSVAQFLPSIFQQPLFAWA